MADVPVALFTVSTGQRLIAALRKSEQAPSVDENDQHAYNAIPSLPFYAQLTGEGATGATPGPGNYSWSLQQVSGGVLSTDSRFSDSNHSASDISSAQGLPAGTKVLMHLAGYDASGNARYLFAVQAIGQVFFVNLTQVGGSNGTVSGSSVTTATYTYNMSEPGGMVVGTALSPTAGRLLPGPVTPATQGIAQWTPSGVSLIYAFEQIAGVGCSNGSGGSSSSNLSSAYYANQTAVPATPTGGGIVFAQAGALMYIGSSGTITTLASA